MRKVAVVTGANKGIGLCIVRNLCKHFEELASSNGLENDGVVYLTSRDVKRGEEAIRLLQNEGLNPVFHTLDIDSEESVGLFAAHLRQLHGGVDILVNNAAISYFTRKDAPLVEQAEETLKTNFFGNQRVFNAFKSLLRPGARIVNMSSALGHLSKIHAKREGATILKERFGSESNTEESITNLVNEYIKSVKDGTHKEAGWPNSAYVVSKIAISALTIVQQREIHACRPNDDILVNSVTPGWVRSDMTGHKGFFSPTEGAVAPTWAALLPPSCGSSDPPIKGAFIWHDMKLIDWKSPSIPS